MLRINYSIYKSIGGRVVLKYYLAKIFKKIRGAAIKDTFIPRSSVVESGSLIVSSEFGRNSFCGYDCVILNTSIGSFCSIASNVRIGGVSHPVHFVSTSPAFLSHKDSIKAKYASHDYLPLIKTVIGNDVWIGEGSYIKAGVNIGDGAVVGMGSVVTKDIPPYAIYAGNPAKLIRFRFDENIITALLNIAWWAQSDVFLEKYGMFFNNPDLFLDEVKRESE